MWEYLCSEEQNYGQEPTFKATKEVRLSMLFRYFQSTVNCSAFLYFA